MLVMVALWMNEKAGLNLMVDLKRNDKILDSFVAKTKQSDKSDDRFYLVVASTKDVADLAAHYSLLGKTDEVVIGVAYSREDFQSLIVFETD